MFDGASNLHLARKLLKVHYPKLKVMRDFELTKSSFFLDVSKLLIVNQMISAHKMIYIIFGSGIHHKPHFIFIGNESRMAGYFMGMYQDLRM